MAWRRSPILLYYCLCSASALHTPALPTSSTDHFTEEDIENSELNSLEERLQTFEKVQSQDEAHDTSLSRDLRDASDVDADDDASVESTAASDPSASVEVKTKLIAEGIIQSLNAKRKGMLPTQDKEDGEDQMDGKDKKHNDADNAGALDIEEHVYHEKDHDGNVDHGEGTDNAKADEEEKEEAEEEEDKEGDEDVHEQKEVDHANEKEEVPSMDDQEEYSEGSEIAEHHEEEEEHIQKQQLHEVQDEEHDVESSQENHDEQKHDEKHDAKLVEKKEHKVSAKMPAKSSNGKNILQQRAADLRDKVLSDVENELRHLSKKAVKA